MFNSPDLSLSVSQADLPLAQDRHSLLLASNQPSEHGIQQYHSTLANTGATEHKHR